MHKDTPLARECFRSLESLRNTWEKLPLKDSTVIRYNAILSNIQAYIESLENSLDQSLNDLHQVTGNLNEKVLRLEAICLYHGITDINFLLMRSSEEWHEYLEMNSRLGSYATPFAIRQAMKKHGTNCLPILPLSPLYSEHIRNQSLYGGH